MSNEDIVVTESDAARDQEIAAAKSKASYSEHIKVGLILKSDVALRDTQRTDEKYAQLVASIKSKGVLNSILVREVVEGGVTKYGLIDGLQRYSASVDLGLETIPANIVTMSDAEVLEAQIVTNVVKLETKPIDLTKHLIRMMQHNPLMTRAQLAEKTNMTPTWVDARLSLIKLSPEVQALVNDNKINLSNAYILSRLDTEEQAAFAEAAVTESPKTFVPRVKERIKAVQQAKRAGTEAGEAVFQPTQHMQKPVDVKREFAILHGEEKGDSILAALLKDEFGLDVKDEKVQKAVKATVAWMLHFDPASKREQQRKYEVRQKAQAEAKEKAKKEREAKKLEREAASAATLMKV